MDSEKGCRPKRGAASSTVGAQRAESAWRPDWIVYEDPFLVAWHCKSFKAIYKKGSFSLKRRTFTKADRIRTSSEYRTLSKNGDRHYSEHFIFISRKNRSWGPRLGITVTKKVGKAVTRNKIKRIIRDYFRLNRSLLPGRLEINVIARPSSGKLGPAEIRKYLIRGFETIAGKRAH